MTKKKSHATITTNEQIANILVGFIVIIILYL